MYCWWQLTSLKTEAFQGMPPPLSPNTLKGEKREPSQLQTAWLAVCFLNV